MSGIVIPVALSDPVGTPETGYAYTVTDIHGRIRAKNITPWRAFAPVSINIAAPATAGTGYQDTKTKTFVLTSVQETLKLASL